MRPDRAEPEHASFTFLGFTFRQRKATASNGQHYSWFLPAISTEALKDKSQKRHEIVRKPTRRAQR